MTWLGGMPCSPRALRVSSNTTTKRVNEVISRRIAGASDASPNSRTMTTVRERPWSPVLKFTPIPGVVVDGEGDGPAVADAGPARTRTRPVARPASRGRLRALLRTDGSSYRARGWSPRRRRYVRAQRHPLETPHKTRPWAHDCMGASPGIDLMGRLRLRLRFRLWCCRPAGGRDPGAAGGGHDLVEGLAGQFGDQGHPLVAHPEDEPPAGDADHRHADALG